MREVSYTWHLRERMAERGMYATSDLIGPLADRGVELSSSQVFRLVTGTPERLSLHMLAALCDLLECGPQELIMPSVVTATGKRTKAAAAGSRGGGGSGLPTPAKARVAEE